MRFVLILLLLSTASVYAQIDYGNSWSITCSMRDTAANAYLSAPTAFLNGTAPLETEFVLNFSDSVPPVAQAAMLFAANIWGSYLQSDVPVVVNVDWEDRMDNQLLASAGPATLFRGFLGSEPDVWYPVALAESIVGRDLNDPGDADIFVNANSTANWYFGTDGNTPRRQIDLVSVMLHELGHGLGFLSSVDTINDNQLTIGFDDRFIVYDLFLETEEGSMLTDPGMFSVPSEELLMAVTDSRLEFTGPQATEENGGIPPPLFSPPTFDGGSSVSHLDESTYPPGSANALMTPFLSAGEAVHAPGPVTLGLFADLGWEVRFDLVNVFQPAFGSLPVFPNPTTDLINLTLPEAAQQFEVKVFTAVGSLARTQVLSSGPSQLSLHGLKPGVYTLVVENGPEVWRSRVVLR